MLARQFVLNVPAADLSQTVLDIGGCSGCAVDKLHKFGDLLGGFCLPGWRTFSACPEDTEDGQKCSTLFAVNGCVAHLVLEALLDLPDLPGLNSHHVLLCQVRQAFVRSTYWDGKIFCPRFDTAETPPFMSFFGSQTFGCVVPTPVE